jgi:hypothetical protein
LCRKADNAAPTRPNRRESSSVCKQCDVIKPLSVSAYSQGGKKLQRKSQLGRAIQWYKQFSRQLGGQARDFGLPWLHSSIGTRPAAQWKQGVGAFNKTLLIHNN